MLTPPPAPPGRLPLVNSKSHQMKLVAPLPRRNFTANPDSLFEAEGINSAVELLPSARGISE